MMIKYIAILLISIAAIEAYSCPGYDYWCAHKFCVFPPNDYYAVDVPFNPCWCTTRFYAECLEEFPKSKGATCEPEKCHEGAVVKVYACKLKCRRHEIEREMRKGLPVLQDQIDDIQGEYFDACKEYLKRVHDPSTQAYEDKIVEYKRQLDKRRGTAVSSFNSAVCDALTKIREFHSKILDGFKKCLATRKCKMDAYNCKVNEKAKDIQEKYAACLKDHIKKRKDWVKCVFDTIYGKKSKGANFCAAMQQYDSLLNDDITCRIASFKKSIASAMHYIKDCYRCNYKCYFHTGCYGFSTKTYTKSKAHLPCPPRYSYRLVRVKLFKPEWKGTAVENLKDKSSEEEESTVFEEKPFHDCIDAKACGFKSDLCAKVKSWKEKVDAWKCGAMSSLKERISCLTPKTFVGKAPTPCEIKAYQRQLECRAESWCEKKKQGLLCQIAETESGYKCGINDWVCKAKAYVTKVKEGFYSCVANKRSKVSQYKCQLENKIKCQRCQLKTRLLSLAADNKCEFDSFYCASFGFKPTDCLIKTLDKHYKSFVDSKVCEVLQKFDDFWKCEKPKLEEHYECGFKCKTKVTIPCLRITFDWTFTAPCPGSLKLE